MSFNFTTVTEELEAFLTAGVPESWKVQDAVKPLGATSGFVLTYQLTGFTTENSNGRFPSEYFLAEFDLILSTPETDGVKAQAKLLPVLPILTGALDASDQIGWDRVEKGLIDTGETVFRLPITVLTTTTPEEE